MGKWSKPRVIPMSSPCPAGLPADRASHFSQPSSPQINLDAKFYAHSRAWLVIPYLT